MYKGKSLSLQNSISRRDGLDKARKQGRAESTSGLPYYGKMAEKKDKEVTLHRFEKKLHFDNYSSITCATDVDYYSFVEVSTLP